MSGIRTQLIECGQTPVTSPLDHMGRIALRFQLRRGKTGLAQQRNPGGNPSGDSASHSATSFCGAAVAEDASQVGFRKNRLRTVREKFAIDSRKRVECSLPSINKVARLIQWQPDHRQMPGQMLAAEARRRAEAATRWERSRWPQRCNRPVAPIETELPTRCV